jgi:hypothetical protein
MWGEGDDDEAGNERFVMRFGVGITPDAHVPEGVDEKDVRRRVRTRIDEYNRAAE